MNEKGLEKETIQYVKNTAREYRKSKGQYFTPRSLREALLERLPKKRNPKILDPGCGTGEFLITAKKYFESPELYGWEIDEKLVEISRGLVPGALIERVDTLEKRETEKYDFVIGNPPYYEFKPTKEMRKEFGNVINGRVNMYGLFIYKGINLLKEGGYLAFVVPPSMNNGAYFAKLRKFIVDSCNIEYLSIQEAPCLFHEALQSVMLLILKKGGNRGTHVFRRNGILIFSEKAEILQKSFRGKTSLCELGYRVHTGRLVWNQNKHLLTDRQGENTFLVWSHNIVKEGLKLNNNKKPQFVKNVSYDVGPAIVVNRIVGRPGRGKIKAALVPEGMRFIAENHVNVISHNEQPTLGVERVKELTLEDILSQLNSPEKIEVVQSITGNTQISKTELENLFPIEM